jgi:hypothetical protein
MSTKDLIVYKPVTRYVTAEGSEHVSREKAQECAEDTVGSHLQTVIHAAGLDLGASTEFELCKYLMANAPEIIDTLGMLHKFEPMEVE